jgi:hypothetical protein
MWNIENKAERWKMIYQSREAANSLGERSGAEGCIDSEIAYCRKIRELAE